MKSFKKFISEIVTQASTQATKMGLSGDGHGDWYDKEGNLVAKTVNAKLKFFGKRRPPTADERTKIEVNKQVAYTSVQSASVGSSSNISPSNNEVGKGLQTKTVCNWAVVDVLPLYLNDIISPAPTFCQLYICLELISLNLILYFILMSYTIMIDLRI